MPKKKSSHKKPTGKEVEKLAEEAEEMQDDPKATADEEVSEEAPEETPVEEPATESAEEEETETDEEVEEETEEPEPPKKPVKTEETDYKKKFSASTREAQNLHKKNKKINEAIDEAGKLPDPTEEELEAEYTDWDIMSDAEKINAKKTTISTRRFEHLQKATEEFRSMDAWSDKVDAFTDDPTTLKNYPALEGNENEFKAFATEKKSRQGTDFEDLVGSFLHSTKAEAKSKKKKKMFETGTGGPTAKSKPKKVSIEEARIIRKTDYNKWKKLLKAGKIEKI